MDPECPSTEPFERRLLLRVHAAIEAKVCKVRKEDQLLVIRGLGFWAPVRKSRSTHIVGNFALKVYTVLVHRPRGRVRLYLGIRILSK